MAVGVVADVDADALANGWIVKMSAVGVAFKEVTSRCVCVGEAGWTARDRALKRIRDDYFGRHRPTLGRLE